MPTPNSASGGMRVPTPKRERPGESEGEPAGAGEFAAIERLAASLARQVGGPPEGETWIGDDAAVLVAPRGQLLFSTDMAVAGVHADLELISVSDLGWRSVAAAISDIAAMGGQPMHAVVAVGGPPDLDLDALYDGIGAAAAAFGCPVVGGDLSAAPTIVVAVAVTGFVPYGARAVTRRGARPGDQVFVTGPLGASAAGLRVLRSSAATTVDSPAQDANLLGELLAAHRRPRPRCAEGKAAREAGVGAMVDISDGLAADLHRLADASGVGFRLERVPVHAGATLDEALGGGEDYELLVATAAPGRLAAEFARAGLSAPLPLGNFVGDRDDRTLNGRPLARRGWEHHFGTTGRS